MLRDHECFKTTGTHLTALEVTSLHKVTSTVLPLKVVRKGLLQVAHLASASSLDYGDLNPVFTQRSLCGRVYV